MSMPILRPRAALVLALLLAAPALGACDESGTPLEPYEPDIGPADFRAGVDHPLFPLLPGTTYELRGESEDGQERSTIEVLGTTRQVMGVAATVVRHLEYIDGELVEETFDWYAQDLRGNVWYLGEDAREMEDGRVVSTDGSWEAGVDGARPGIVMWGDPAAHLGEAYFQEYAPGEAVDKGKVVALDETVQVPFGRFTGCLKTEDWDPLEPGVLENKFYCPGIGLVREVQVRGGVEYQELTAMTRP